MAGYHLHSIRKYFSLKRLMLFWYQHYKKLFLVGFIGVLGSGGYFWYSNLYQYQWTEEKKNQFVEQHFKATVFREKQFRQLVDGLKDRAKRHEEPVSLARDIFSGNALR
jgi:hypothetical protein